MSDSKYQCRNDSDLQYCSLSNDECLRAFCARYDAMLEFLNNFIKPLQDRDDFFESWQDDCKELLREIGEL